VDERWREILMAEKEGLCIVCGRKTAWEDLVPVKLVRERDGVLLSGACGACMLDVDKRARENRKGKEKSFVLADLRGKTWRVERR
jgi:hypothetical protein